MCPGLEQLERLAAGELPIAEQSALRGHLADCEPCRTALREVLVNLSVAARVAAAPAPENAPTITPRHADPDPDDSTTGAPTSVHFDGYDHIRELSRGGQGVVYKATQTATKQRVAIKVLLHGPHAPASHRRRFEREIELAAQLRHPNIVSVLHSSAMPDGRAFLVMDYIRGAPLDAYVKSRKLPLKDVLELFAQVCDAVQYAHQRGIIHRDLKPSNILVDASGNPRVLDFGLAKRLSASADTYDTMTMQLLGTLAYMSPEHARGNPDEVDTRSDVYSLGVILYQVLTGAFPYPVSGAMPEILHHILQTAPASATQSWSAQSGVPLAAEGNPASGVCPFDDEVETIVMKCLAKERERRYQSAGELGRDLRHYLAGEPIEAKRDSAIYMLRKALRRYRLAAILGSLGVAVIALAAGVSTWQWRQAEASRRQAERTNEFLRQILTTESSVRVRGVNTPFLEVLEDALGSLDKGQLREWPEVECDLRLTLAQGFFFLGIPKKAEEQAGICVEQARKLRAQPSRRLSDALHHQGRIAWDLGDLPGSSAYLEESLSLRKQIHGPDSVQVAETLTSLGFIAWDECRTDEAESLTRRAADILRAANPGSPRALADALSILGLVLERQGRLDDAQSMFLEASDQLVDKLGKDVSTFADTRCNSARVLRVRGDTTHAKAMLEDLVRSLEQVVGPTHYLVMVTRHDLGWTRFAAGDNQGAIDDFRASLAGIEQSLGVQHQTVSLVKRGLGVALMASGELPEAEIQLRDSAEIIQRTRPGREEYVAVCHGPLGECLTLQRRFAEAEPLLLSSHDALVRHQGCMSISRVPQAARRLAEFYELRRTTSEAKDADEAEAKRWRAKLKESLAKYPHLPESICTNAGG